MLDLFVPGARRRARALVDVEQDLPDLLLGQHALPYRHRRQPGRRALGQARPAGGDAPVDVGLLQHADRADIAKVGRQRREGAGKVAVAGQRIAVAVEAVAVVDRLALSGVFGQRGGVAAAQRVLQRHGLDALAMRGEARRRLGVHHARRERRVPARRGAQPGAIAHQQRQRGQHQHLHEPGRAAVEYRPQGGEKVVPARLVGGDEDDDAQRRQHHVDHQHAGRHRRLHQQLQAGQDGQPQRERDGEDVVQHQAPALRASRRRASASASSIAMLKTAITRPRRTPSCDHGEAAPVGL